MLVESGAVLKEAVISEFPLSAFRYCRCTSALYLLPGCITFLATTPLPVYSIFRMYYFTYASIPVSSLYSTQASDTYTAYDLVPASAYDLVPYSSLYSGYSNDRGVVAIRMNQSLWGQ